MATFTGEIIIECPVDLVFDTVADQRNEPEYNALMTESVKLTDGPIGVGTRFRAVTTSHGRPVEMLIEYTGYDRPRALASTTTIATAEVRGGLTFNPDPRGTRMRWSWTVTPKGSFKALTPVITLLGRRREDRVWAALKRQLEARPD